MDFTNINDPAGVKALLDQLRTSQAWQDLREELHASPPSNNSPTDSSHVDMTHGHSLSSGQELESSVVSEHISSLLFRLQSGGNEKVSPATSSRTPDLVYLQQGAYMDLHHHNDARTFPPACAAPSSPRIEDPRVLGFNQALPVISQLSEDPVFMEKLEKLQTDQAHLERKLWQERSDIVRAQREKAQVAQAKSSIIGTGLSQNDAKTLQTSFEKELNEFDRGHVLAAWDTLVAKQQAALEGLCVPGIFTTTALAGREKQQRIIQVLEGLSDHMNNDVEP